MAANVSGNTTNGTAFTLPTLGSKLARKLLTFFIGIDVALTKNLSAFIGDEGQSLLDSDNDAYQSVGYVGGARRW